jgi:hypothetical protein
MVDTSGKRLEDGLGESHVLKYEMPLTANVDSGSTYAYWPNGQRFQIGIFAIEKWKMGPLYAI